MERFCVEIAIHFLRQWLLNNWSGSYALEIFWYVCDRHIHDSQACDTHGMRVSLVTVVTGGPF